MFYLIFFALLFSRASDSSISLAQELRQRDQALLDAIAPGEAKVWDEALAPSATYVDENGVAMSRSEFMKTINPLPAGVSGSLKIVSYSASRSGDVASVVHTDDESEEYHGQHLHARYLMTETWQEQNGDWKLLMVHATAVLLEPKEILLSTAELDAYVGHYSAGQELSYIIARDGDHLSGQRPGHDAVPLKAEVRDVFFVGSQLRTRKIFQRDSSGKITGFVDRREGSDLVWKRVP